MSNHVTLPGYILANQVYELSYLNGIQELITNDNKLSADLIENGSTNKVVTATDISNWNAKVSNVQGDWNVTDSSNEAYIRNKPEIPSISGLATEQYVNTEIANIVNSAPETLDTLNELATALGNDPNFATTVSNQIGTKVSKSDLVSQAYLQSESDPTVPSHVKSITSQNISDWNAKVSISQLVAQAYLQSESDPTVPTYVKNITEANISSWNSKLSSFTESDPTVPTYVKNITEADITNWNNKLNSFTELDPTVPTYVKNITEADISNWNSKTSNVGTITGINMNGSSKGTSGVVDLGTVITSNAKHKLTVATGSTTANSGNSITFIESLTGTSTATDGDLTLTPTKKTITIPVEVTETTVSNWGFTKNTGTLTSESDPVFTASAAHGITSTDITNWNDKISKEDLVEQAYLQSHAKHKLTIASSAATANSGNTITFIESLTGTTTATEGDLILTPTTKTMTIPSAVSESTVSGWGFTKNAGTLTGVKFNNTNATVSNGVASITATIPPEVTESTVSGWGFTKNTGTLTSHAQHKLTIATGTTTANSGNNITFIESLTGTTTATDGDLTLTPTKKTITIPSAANNATITIQKGGTTIDSFTTDASSNKTINIPNELPSYSSSDSGKVLSVNSSGQLVWITPVSIYTGSGTPSNSLGNNGDIYLQS